MKRKSETLSEPGSHATRIAWWASFFATIAVVAILGMARSAQASTPPAGAPGNTLAPLVFGPAAEESEEETEELEGAEECAEEEGEECEEGIAGEGSDVCIVRSASATVSVSKGHDKVRLALRYTASVPAVVKVDYSLRGHRGAQKMGGDSRRFSRSGVFRDTETFSSSEVTRVSAAKEFDVRVHAVNTPSYCHRLLDRDLKAHHPASAGVLWTD